MVLSLGFRVACFGDLVFGILSFWVEGFRVLDFRFVR